MKPSLLSFQTGPALYLRQVALSGCTRYHRHCQNRKKENSYESDLSLPVFVEKKVLRPSLKEIRQFFLQGTYLKPHTYVFFSIYRGRHFQCEVIDVTNVRDAFIGQSKGGVNLSQSIEGAVHFLKILAKSAKSCRGAEWIVNYCLAEMIYCHLIFIYYFYFGKKVKSMK